MADDTSSPEDSQSNIPGSDATASTLKSGGRKPQKTEKKAAPGRGIAVFVDIVFNVILVGSMCFIGFMLFEQYKSIEVLFAQQNALGNQRNDTGIRLDQLQVTVQTLENALALAREESADSILDYAAEIERLESELVSTRLRISSNNSGASQAWLLEEAASLLRLAQQHLVVAKSVRTAQALYIAADDVLKQIDDPAIFAVREVLAGELAAIRAVDEVDVREIYLRLGAVAEQAATLQVSNDLAAQIAEGAPVEFAQDAGEEAGWVSRLMSSIGNTLDKYLVVRRRDLPLQPLMTPGQEAVLMQTIQLQIEQARSALIIGRQEIYTQSLELAQANIDQFLSGNASVKSVVINTIDNLKQRRIVTEPPPLNRTRTALQALLVATQTQTIEPVSQQ